MSKTMNKFFPEVRQHAARLVLDNEGQHGSRWKAVLSISAKISCAPQTLSNWAKKAKVYSGKRPSVSSEMSDLLEALERENRELRQGTRAYVRVSGERHRSERAHERVFCDDRRPCGTASSTAGDARPPVEVIVGFNVAHRDVHGVEPICSLLRIASFTFMIIWRSDPIPRGCRTLRVGTWNCSHRSGSSHDDQVPPVIRVFDVGADGVTLSNQRDFALIDAGLPDGIRCDDKGNLWSSAADGIHVFAPDGALLGKFHIPEVVSNLCFGGPRWNRLFITGTTLNVDGGRLARL